MKNIAFSFTSVFFLLGCTCLPLYSESAPHDVEKNSLNDDVSFEHHLQTNNDHVLFDSLRELYVESFQQEEQKFIDLYPKENYLENHSITDYLRGSWKWQSLRSDDTMICVCAKNNKNICIGFAIFVIETKAPNLAHLKWLGVSPAHRNYGISRQLIFSIFEIISTLTSISLTTLITNNKARSVYRHYGFVESTNNAEASNPYLVYLSYTK